MVMSHCQALLGVSGPGRGDQAARKHLAWVMDGGRVGWSRQRPLAQRINQPHLEVANCVQISGGTGGTFYPGPDRWWSVVVVASFMCPLQCDWAMCCIKW